MSFFDNNNRLCQGKRFFFGQLRKRRPRSASACALSDQSLCHPLTPHRPSLYIVKIGCAEVYIKKGGFGDFSSFLTSFFLICLLRLVTFTPEIWPRGYKTFFMLTSAEHEIFCANRYEKCQQELRGPINKQESRIYHLNSLPSLS